MVYKFYARITGTFFERTETWRLFQDVFFPSPPRKKIRRAREIIDTITSGHGIGNGWFARDFRIQSALFAESAKTLPNSSEGKYFANNG